MDEGRQLLLFDNLPKAPTVRGIGAERRHPLHGCWAAMKARCYSRGHDSFGRYGARGIVVAPEFLNFRVFVEWAMSAGWRPGLQIDRVDNDGPYSPENCRFVTRSQNQQNQRRTLRLADGRSAYAVALENGVRPATFRARVLAGWSLELAVLPSARRNNRVAYEKGKADGR